jgi:Cu/Ag efflux protein CusF
MMPWLWILSTFSFAFLIPTVAKSSLPSDPAVRVFLVRSVVVRLQPEHQIVVIRHVAISNYMEAMAMPFKVRTVSELNGLQPGSEVNFDLHVGTDKGCVANLVPTGTILPFTAPISPAPDELLPFH